jgi:hypothetical protein
MSFPEPTSQPRPEQTPEFVSARARRRRAQRRAYFPTDEEGRAALFEHLARRAFPSYELFVFSLVAGAILGLGYFFNAQALLIFGILVAPLLTPWIGTALSIIAGAPRLFLQTFTALSISSLIIFFCGWLAGLASRTFQPLTFNEAFTHSRLWWPDLIVLTIASVLITISFVRSEDRPYLPSALLAYELFLPLCAAGFGLGSSVGGLWPQGLFVFIVHLAWATFFGIITLLFLRFYPTSFGGLVFTGLIFIALIAIVTSYTGLGNWMMIKAGLSTAEPVPAIVSTSTPVAIPSSTQSPEPAQGTGVSSNLIGTPSQTPKPTLTTVTLAATDTPTSTVTAEPTPILAIIRASEGGGAFIREKPGGIVLVTLGNGSTVTIIPNDLQDVNGVIWVHVFAIVNDARVEGWMIQTVLQTATPVANWQPSPTP